MFTTGKYDVLNLAEKEFSEKEDYELYIDTNQQYLSGKFDCNEFSVNYQVKDDNILEFGFATATKMYCEGEMGLENKFFGIVKTIKYFNLKDDELSFYNEKGDIVLKLKKQKS